MERTGEIGKDWRRERRGEKGKRREKLRHESWIQNSNIMNFVFPKFLKINTMYLPTPSSVYRKSVFCHSRVHRVNCGRTGKVSVPVNYVNQALQAERFFGLGVTFSSILLFVEQESGKQASCKQKYLTLIA